MNTKPRIFTTVLHAHDIVQERERVGEIHHGNTVQVCFSVFLASLSVEELGALLDHSVITTTLIQGEYLKKCVKQTEVREGNENEYVEATGKRTSET